MLLFQSTAVQSRVHTYKQANLVSKMAEQCRDMMITRVTIDCLQLVSYFLMKYRTEQSELYS